MTPTIFVNLPVADVAASTAFYEAMGMTKDVKFSNANASAMVWSDAIRFMLLAHPFYSTFTAKPIGDAHTTSAALLCLTCEDREAVDRIAAAALAAGGRELHGAEDHGFMYGRAFDDLDGHSFQVMYLDVAAMPAP